MFTVIMQKLVTTFQLYLTSTKSNFESKYKINVGMNCKGYCGWRSSIFSINKQFIKSDQLILVKGKLHIQLST